MMRGAHVVTLDVELNYHSIRRHTLYYYCWPRPTSTLGSVWLCASTGATVVCLSWAAAISSLSVTMGCSKRFKH